MSSIINLLQHARGKARGPIYLAFDAREADSIGKLIQAEIPELFRSSLLACFWTQTSDPAGRYDTRIPEVFQRYIERGDHNPQHFPTIIYLATQVSIPELAGVAIEDAIQHSRSEQVIIVAEAISERAESGLRQHFSADLDLSIYKSSIEQTEYKWPDLPQPDDFPEIIRVRMTENRQKRGPGPQDPTRRR